MASPAIESMEYQPLETPVLKVSRPVAACSRCRNAKIKCDGKLPACSSCEKNGRAAECTSTNDQFARGKERSYVSTLETRIDKLQTRLEDARARKPSVIDVPEEDEPATAVPSRRPSRQISPQEPPTPNTSRQLKRRERNAMDDLVSDFGFLSVNATARDFYGFTAAMSYARLVLRACSKDDLPTGVTKALPSRQDATTLIQHYLANIYVLLPVFDEASFYASVDNVLAKGYRYADPLDHWMVRLVLAIASASMSRRRGDAHYMNGIAHVCAALEYAEAVLHPGNISGVQALVLLVEYAMLDPHHFDSWGLIGAASRAMADLGLHSDPPKGTAMPRGKLELRRRVFYCIYTLDRSTSLVQTRALSFSDDSTKVKIPFHKPANSAPASPSGQNGTASNNWFRSFESTLDFINLRKLQSTWYTDLFQSGRTAWDEPYQYLWDTCDGMRKWFDDVSPTTDPNMRAFFELDLLYSYVYVLSPSPRVPTPIPFAQKLIFEYCIRYADLMIRLISDPAYTAPLTFYDAMRVYMTGRQFLDAIRLDIDLLLSGVIPPHPEVKLTTAPPPPMPVANLPPGETVQRFNTVRSISCIMQITNSLANLGARWGFQSWHQRFQNAAAATLEDLQKRLREYDEVNGVNRRPSMWHGSVGSHASSNGSFTYTSPPRHISQASTGYPAQYAQTPPSMQVLPGYMEQQQISPPQTNHQQAEYFSQPHPGAHYGHPQQTYHNVPQQQQQQFTFNEPVYQAASRPMAAPNQQFAAWGGYGGPSVPDTLDAENANPYTAGDFFAHSTNAGPSLQSPRVPPSRLGPSPKLSVSVPAAESFGERNPSLALLQPVDSNPMHPYNQYKFSIPSTAVLPPLGGTGPYVSAPANKEDPSRRISMHDGASDMLRISQADNSLQALAHMALPLSHQPQPMQAQSYTGKGKGRAEPNAVPYFSPNPNWHQPYQQIVRPGSPRFWYRAGIGYICVACNRVCHALGLHRTLGGGAGCVDLGAEVSNVPNSAPVPGLMPGGPFVEVPGTAHHTIVPQPGNHVEMPAPVQQESYVIDTSDVRGFRGGEAAGAMEQQHMQVHRQPPPAFGVQDTQDPANQGAQDQGQAGRRVSEASGLFF